MMSQSHIGVMMDVGSRKMKLGNTCDDDEDLLGMVFIDIVHDNVHYPINQRGTEIHLIKRDVTF